MRRPVVLCHLPHRWIALQDHRVNRPPSWYEFPLLEPKVLLTSLSLWRIHLAKTIRTAVKTVWSIVVPFSSDGLPWASGQSMKMNSCEGPFPTSKARVGRRLPLDCRGVPTSSAYTDGKRCSSLVLSRGLGHLKKTPKSFALSSFMAIKSGVSLPVNLKVVWGSSVANDGTII